MEASRNKKVIAAVSLIAVFSLAFTEILLLIRLQPVKFNPPANITQVQSGKNVTFVIESISDTPSMASYAPEIDKSTPTGQMSYFFPEGAIRTSWKRYNNVDHYIITGYAFTAGENIYMPDVSLIILDENSGQYYKIHTEVQRRKDITESFSSDGCNYDLSGLKGSISKKYIKENHAYRICLLYNSSVLVKSEHYLIEELSYEK